MIICRRGLGPDRGLTEERFLSRMTRMTRIKRRAGIAFALSVSSVSSVTNYALALFEREASMKIATRTLLLLATLVLASCGFQLRGEVDLPPSLERIHLVVADPLSPL